MGRCPSSRRAAVALVVLAGAACDEGPFARANAYDPQSDVAFELRATRDTLSVVGDRVLFQLISDPPQDIPARLWGTDRPDLLLHLGNGYYELRALPPSPAQVRVFITIGVRADTASVVVSHP